MRCGAGDVVVLDQRHRVRGVETGRAAGSGASRSRKHSSWTVATSSAPKPAVLGASSTVMQRPVLDTEAAIVSSSSGTSERMSTTSTLMPSSAATLRGLEGVDDLVAPREDRHVLALARDARLPDRDGVVALGDLVPDQPVALQRLPGRSPGRGHGWRRQQQPLGIGGRRRRHDLDTRVRWRASPRRRPSAARARARHRRRERGS
jgi:hypothetical protein